MSPTSYQAAPPRADMLPYRGRDVKGLPARVFFDGIAVEDLVFLHHVEPLPGDALVEERIPRGVLVGLVRALRGRGQRLLAGAPYPRLVLERPDVDQSVLPAHERVDEVAQQEPGAPPEQAAALLLLLGGGETEKAAG